MENKPLPFASDVSGCRDHVIGTRGVSKAEFNAQLERATASIERLRKLHAAGRSSLLDIPTWTHDLEECADVADQLTKGGISDVVVIGIGGSSLGGQAIAGFAEFMPSIFVSGKIRPKVKLHFCDNLESPWCEMFFDQLDMATTSFLVVSKSGRTAETLVLAIMAIERLKKTVLAKEFARRIVILSEPASEKDNPLRRLAHTYRLRIIDHHRSIGGRYSVLSNVGVIPALLSGIDPSELRAGAALVADSVLASSSPEQSAAVTGACIYRALAQKHGLNAMVTMPYSSRLRSFAAWLAQLWAESLGKNGFGSQPVTAVGPLDQHSQLQLFLDGPNDKLFNIIALPASQKSFRVNRIWEPIVGPIGGHTVSHLTDSQQRATVAALVNHARPVRCIRLERLDARTLGALFMHFMVETILVAFMAGIDPFDQPAVEEAKKITLENLAQRT